MREKGFTLIELMVTVTILGIVAAMAVPSFSVSIKKQQVRSMADDIFTAMSFARAEAVRSGLSVEVVPTDGSSWAEGLIVRKLGDEDSVFRSVSGKKNLPITEANNLRSIQYDGRGFVKGFDAGSSAVSFECVQFDLGDNATLRRQVLVLVSGFAAVKEQGGCE